MMSAAFDPSKFIKYFERGETQLVWRWIVADTETPVSAYLKLTDGKTCSGLFESVEGGATLGRYTILALDPDFVWTKKQADVKTKDELRALLKDCHIAHIPEGLPPMAASGLFGYMAYDMIRAVEDIPNKNPDPLHMPDSILFRPRLLVIFDNIKHQICVVAPVYQHANNTALEYGRVLKEAQARIDGVLKALAKSVPQQASPSKISLPIEPQANMTQDQYESAVRKAIEYIYAGDIFQVVPSQRFSFDFDLPAFDLYRSLRRLNPSPFLFYVQMPGFALVGSSPEIMVRVRDDEVTVRPIAGTRWRGKTPAEDQALADDLLSDPKERAEHLMLLDLGRNDVGRVAEIGSVKVTDQFFVEFYSHVMHIVSNVTGKLRKDFDILDALFSGFPAGTVSGAPKVRAMEIIDELENVQRKFYAGCVGYLSGNGNLDTCIALRTSLVKDGKVYVQAGAGVVADSVPASEYQECVNKAKAIVRAAEEAVTLSQQA